MKEITAKARTVNELLKGVKYSIDYYQREFKWQEKQIRELIDDLTGKFLEEYDPAHPRIKVADYPHYFLGSIIISKKENGNYIVDGQQRLTSLTLLLVFLRNLQKESLNKVFIDELIYSEKFGQKSFNMDVDEREECMTNLFKGEILEGNDQPESIKNLINRYNDIQISFPEELEKEALPYFIDWLIENVQLVEISAYSDDDAYTIFETMNDRGLSLTPIEMLKGYLLANIEQEKRNTMNEFWKDRIKTFNDISKDTASDFFKAWLRSQYATKIRERRKNASPEDFDRIGTEFHRWLRDASSTIGLKQDNDYLNFLKKDFDFYSKQYLQIIKASKSLISGQEHILYNAQLGFTLQPMLLLAPLRLGDSDEVTKKKMDLVAHYLDILLNWRLWNFRLIAYSTMQYKMFLDMREIRGLNLDDLSSKLYDLLTQERETFKSNDRLRVHQQNRYSIHRILARISDYLEVQTGNPSKYMEFLAEGKNRYEIEHIWADNYSRFEDEFSHPSDFSEQRNRIGGLLLLPKKFNASYGALSFEEKVEHYNSQNHLARSLHPLSYERNPGFKQFIQRTGLPFKSYEHFKSADLEERSQLYRQIAEQIWNPEAILRERSNQIPINNTSLSLF
jgi:uncharacterized protein with ParB-like and HNH nuclease domain